jgi:hypothetical protein
MPGGCSGCGMQGWTHPSTLSVDRASKNRGQGPCSSHHLTERGSEVWNGTAHAAEVTIAVTLRRWLADTSFEKGPCLPMPGTTAHCGKAKGQDGRKRAQRVGNEPMAKQAVAGGDGRRD